MTHTVYRNRFDMLIPNRALGYAPAPTGSGFRTSMSNWEQTGDGSVQLSVDDALRWDEHFYHPRVGGQTMVDELQQRGTLTNGDSIGVILLAFRLPVLASESPQRRLLVLGAVIDVRVRVLRQAVHNEIHRILERLLFAGAIPSPERLECRTAVLDVMQTQRGIRATSRRSRADHLPCRRRDHGRLVAAGG